MKIAVIGGGYVGLVTGACLANFGHGVTIVEGDPTRYAMLASGKIPIHEPGLEELVALQCEKRLLSFAPDLRGALEGVDAVFLAVGTPSRRGDGHADLTYIFAAVRQVAAALTAPAVLVTKSTVPVGTGRRIANLMQELRPDLAIDVASNPEFLREGKALLDFMRPDRIVVGCAGAHARALLEAIYAPLTARGAKLLVTGIETAELIKYAANSFLAMKISFINEMADICERVAADVADLVQGLGLDSRIGAQFLQPGPGFGGSCFPKDTEALARIAQDAGAPSRLVESTIAANSARKAGLGARINQACGGSVAGLKIAVLGLTFKPDTDDLRDSPALPVMHRMVEDGATVHAYDPQGMEQARLYFDDNVSFHDSAKAALLGADVAIIMTEWAEFQRLSARDMHQWMRGHCIIDMRNVFEPSAFQAEGFSVTGIGRPWSAIQARPLAEIRSTRETGSQRS